MEIKLCCVNVWNSPELNLYVHEARVCHVKDWQLAGKVSVLRQYFRTRLYKCKPFFLIEAPGTNAHALGVQQLAVTSVGCPQKQRLNEAPFVSFTHCSHALLHSTHSAHC